MPPRSSLLVPTVVVSALLVSGCSPDTAPRPSAPPTAESEAKFASDDAALSAAEIEYERYVDVAYAVFSDPSRGTESLQTVAVGEVLASDVERAEIYAAEGLRQAGRPTTIATRLKQYAPSPGIDQVVIHTCVDGYSSEVVDQQGRSLSDPNRAKAIIIENTFIEVDATRLMLRSSTVLGKGDTCEF